VKRLLLGTGVVLALVLAAGAVLVLRTLRRLGTPEFRQEILAEARSALGTDVEARSLEVSILRGFRLGGLRIANPRPLSGDLLTSESFSLGYDLWPLLRGRVQIDDLTVDRPVIRLVADGRGAFNYERLKPYASVPSAPTSAAARAGSSFLREVVIERLALKDGALSLSEGKQSFLRLDDLDFESRLAVGPAGSVGKGEAQVKALVLAEALFVRDVRAPIEVSKRGLGLAPLRASLAGGAVKGQVRVDLAPDFRWALDLEVGGASVATLLKEASATPMLAGTLEASATLAGTGGAPTAKGKGRTEIRDCQVVDSKVMTALAALLQLPELAAPRFDLCRVDFDVAGGVARTPLLFKGRTLELTGRGTYGLVTSALDYDMTLALGPDLLARIPGNTTRAAFKKRDDGFGTLDFGVTGTPAAPRVDLVQRLGVSLATEAAKEGIRKLFRKKSN
jgi:uncharacterized protein YhdP